VANIAQLLLEAMHVKNAEVVYTGGQRGWSGDVPQVRLDCGKLERMGWKAKLTSDAAVKLAVAELVEELNGGVVTSVAGQQFDIGPGALEKIW